MDAAQPVRSNLDGSAQEQALANSALAMKCVEMAILMVPTLKDAMTIIRPAAMDVLPHAKLSLAGSVQELQRDH